MKNYKRFTISVAILVLAILAISTSTVFAADPPQPVVAQLRFPIPGMGSTLTLCDPDSSGTKLVCEGIARYITTIYTWLIGVIAILAVVALMVGGVQWLMAGGSDKRVTAAKKTITNSLVGLLLSLGSYLLLWTISPNLVQFRPLTIKVAEEIDVRLEVRNEASEAVLHGETKGMECFFETFGRTEQEVESNLTQVSFLGKNFQLHKKAADALKKAGDEIQSKNIQYNLQTFDGSFNWRPNRNDPSQMSLHSFGIAFDINQAKNPNIKPRPGGKCASPPNCPQKCPTDIPDSLVEIMINNGFRWGGNYRNVCDAMHFEWIGPCKK